MGTQIPVIVNFILAYFTIGIVSGNIYPSSDHYSVTNKKNVYFETQSQTFRIKMGDDIIFPCHVVNRGKNVITWKSETTGSDERLLTAGPIKVYAEDRLIHDTNGTDITIRGVEEQDSGEYSCEVNLKAGPLTLTHTLDVLVPPSVTPQTEEVTVKSGGGTQLECRATGNPTPHIHWRRGDGRTIQGETKGNTLFLEKVSRDDSGVFVCVAQNGVDTKTEVSAEIQLHVLYPPEIIVHHRHYHPKLGQKKLELVCQVLADPSPDVNWHRGPKVLSGHVPHQDKYTMEANIASNIHTLSINHITEEDYGNYTCHATNRLGDAKEIIVVSGKPLKPVITSSSESRDKNSYRLTWRIESPFPVISHNLHYQMLTKPLQRSKSKTRLNCEKVAHCFMLNLANGDGRHRSGRGEYASHVKKEAEFIFDDLIPDSYYLVQIQTVNEFGKSHWSDVFQFNTYAEIATPVGPWSPFSSVSSNVCVHASPLATLLWAILLWR